MSTNAIIAIQNEIGSFDAIYLHFDGYPEHAGVVLQTHFNSPELAKQLVLLGALRSIDRKTGAVETYAEIEGEPKRIMRFDSFDRIVDHLRLGWCRHLYVFKTDRWVHVLL